MPLIYVPDPEQSEEIGRPTVQLVGTDGNVFALMAECKRAMKRYKKEVDPNYNVTYMFDEMFDEIKQGDYDNALRVMMGYLEVS